MSDQDDLKQFIATFMEEAEETLESWEKTCLEMEKNPSSDSFTTLFRYAHNLKGSSRSVNLDAFASFIHKVEDVITLLRDGKCEYTPAYVALFFKCHSLMEYWCDNLKENIEFVPDEIADIEKIIEEFTSLNSSSDIPKILDGHEFGIFSNNELKIEQDSTNKEKNSDKNLNNIDFNISKNKSYDTIRISSSKIDIIMHYISELCTHHSIISHCNLIGKYNSKSFSNSIQICEKIIKELQSNVFSLRMLPLTSLFQRLERAAKSLAIQQNKDLTIDTEGLHVELDKNIIEKFVDPLVHVIRNAVDHGIEKTEERISKNKPIKSFIHISAKQNTSHVTITITDDGKGINPNIILKKAIQKNLISENAKLSEQEIYQLLFLPGFSTADSVTEVSGRGVGLDVVKQVLEEIGGYVNIKSQIDRGSSFEFNLPSNLSIIDVLTINVSNLKYVVPISEINEVLDLSKLVSNKVTNSEKVSMINNIPSIIKNLGEYLKNEINFEENKNSEKQVGLIVELNSTLYIFEIDEIIGIESVVFRKKSEKFQNLKYFTGSTVLPSGEPAFILSLKELINQLIIPMENHIKQETKEMMS
ncbi:chemotaxis protein CheA [Silvanigrella aquatica]|uniref:histidine kinase n=1 Tax=Silvanigrella aquatica TaxID=1915309 RepID=A0A1L4CYY8_9BACT|nr:ATP-binding protein [Silvanigrella aquatica]APJ03161.1 hypothetical protein AXG55_04275 [Silvanigrella aquatica]